MWVDKAWYGEFIEEIFCHPEVKNYITILENINDYDLEILYQNCRFTLYPSLYEGFGLPVIESLGYGSFCISSSATSLPEAGKNYVEYIHPLDVLGWAEKILFYLENKNELLKRKRFIKEHYVVPTWNNCIARVYNEIYHLI